MSHDNTPTGRPAADQHPDEIGTTGPSGWFVALYRVDAPVPADVAHPLVHDELLLDASARLGPGDQPLGLVPSPLTASASSRPS